MKYVFSVAVCLLLTLAFIACGQQTTKPPAQQTFNQTPYRHDASGTHFNSVLLNKHNHILAWNHSGGIAFEHDPDCPCQKGRTVKDDKTLPPGAHILLDGEKPSVEKP